MILLLFSSLFASASITTVIVEDVKDRKATVYVPHGVTLNPGDQLFKNKPEEPLTAPFIQSAEVKATVIEEKQLRKREHLLEIEYSRTEVEIKTTSPVESKTNVRGVKLGAIYGYNFGSWTPFAGVNTDVSKGESSETGSVAFELGASYNFIKNEPGNDLIPYVAFSVESYREDFEDETSDLRTTGTLYSGYLGLLWYPFSELFAILLPDSSLTC